MLSETQGTIDDFSVTADTLPDEVLSTWDPYRRINLAYGVIGGIRTVDRRDIRRSGRVIDSCTAQGRSSLAYDRDITPSATSLFQITSHICTDRFGVRSADEDSYVSWMHAYLSGNAPPSSPFPVPWATDLTTLRCTAGEVDPPMTIRYIAWYSL